MKSFDTVILGSGYFSIGYAFNSDSVLIIERTQLADPNFGGTLSGFTFNASAEWTNETQSLYRYYMDKKIVSGISMNSSVSEVGLCAYIEKRNINILLGTECVGIKKLDEGYEITLINNGGYDRLLCKKILDTRYLDGKRYLNVLCRGFADTSALGAPENFEFAVTGAFETEEYVIEFAFADGVNVNVSKVEALRFLEKNFAGCGAQIVQCAYAMHASRLLPAYEYGEIPVVHEISFGDAFAAFDAGVRAAFGGVYEYKLSGKRSA